MEQKKPFYKSIWMKLIAIVLVIAMVLSIVVGAFTAVQLPKQDPKDNEAISYLQENNTYMDLNAVRRASEKLESLLLNTYDAVFQRLQVAIAEERYEDALELSKKCLSLKDERDEDYVNLLLSRGCIEVMLNKNEEALKSFDRVLQFEPENLQVLLLESQIYFDTENYDELERVLLLYVEIDSENAAIIDVLANLYLSEMKYKDACTYFEKWFALDDLDEETAKENAFKYGVALMAETEYEEAVIYLQKHLDAGGTEEGCSYYIGTAKMSLERIDEAVEAFTEAIDKKEFLQLSYYSRGLCYLSYEEQKLEEAMNDMEATFKYEETDADATIKAEAEKIYNEIYQLLYGGIV